jgi:PAS domain S-box-containing protein
MSFSQATASHFWFPESVLLCALLLTPRRSWWMFVLGALPIRLILPTEPGMPFWFLFDTFVVDSATGVVTALALQRCLADALRLRTVRDFAIYCLIAVVLVPAGAAFLGAGARDFLGHDYWEAWRQWFLGNALTNLVITPAILYGLLGAARSSKPAPPARWIEGLVVMTGLIVASYVAFETTPAARGFAEPQFYAPIPFLFWAALRFGIPGASAGVAVITIISVTAALRGEGPFAGYSPNDTALALQEFLLLRAAPLYLVGILTEQKAASDEQLTRSEQRYREVVESQTELVCRFLADGTLSFVSEAFCRAFARERETLMGSDFASLMLPASGETTRAQLALALRGERGERGEWECQVSLPDGKVGWQQWMCHIVGRTDTHVTELQAIGRDITDRKRAEEADRSLSGKLIEAQEQERARIARDLHDDINQRLASASIDISAILRHTNDGPMHAELGRLQTRLIALSEDIRRMSHNLHPSLLQFTGLSAALDALCNSIGDADGPSIVLHLGSQTDDLPADVALCLYRAAQEGLRNAIRHAKASHVDVEFRLSGGCAELRITDDGVGVVEGARPRGLGLFSLEERAKFLGGRFDLTTAPGRGVRISVSIPIRDLERGRSPKSDSPSLVDPTSRRATAPQ